MMATAFSDGAAPVASVKAFGLAGNQNGGDFFKRPGA
jgi:hypothetical protein